MHCFTMFGISSGSLEIFGPFALRATSIGTPNTRPWPLKFAFAEAANLSLVSLMKAPHVFKASTFSNLKDNVVASGSFSLGSDSVRDVVEHRQLPDSAGSTKMSKMS